MISAGAEPAPTSLQSQLRQHLQVEKYTLPNGLTVILHEDHGIPMVAFHQWFRVGSSHEKPGRTGLAHFFEHLMFKGTEKWPNIDAVVNGHGGSFNAFTSRDYTGYYAIMPSSKLDTIVDIEADRMVNLNFDVDAIEKERQVVKEERRVRLDNSPAGKLNEVLYKTVYKTSPYRWPIIGYMKDLNAATVKEFRDFYGQYYAPNNAVVVVVGAFSSSKVKGWIEEHYGALKSKVLPETKLAKEPKQKSRRRTTHKMDVNSARMIVAYQGPDAYNKDGYAMGLLSDVLAGGPSSRLHKTLVRRRQLATSVYASQSGSVLEGMFSVAANLRPGISRSRTLGIINSEIRKIRNKGVTEAELQRAKNQTMLGYTQALRSIRGKANILAYSEIVYKDPTMFFSDLDSYAAVSVEDIKKAAKLYLNENQQSVVAVVPKGK